MSRMIRMIRIIVTVLVLCSFSTTFATEDSKEKLKTEKITINDARDKRQLSNFNDNVKSQIQRRITTNYAPYPTDSLYVNPYNSGGGSYDKDFSVSASSYPKAQNFGPTYSIQPSQYVGGYQQQHYVEAPEPIIEIIIKDSNETLPTPEPLKYQSPKKKKEQVQVFYVKYNKDEKKGLVIDDPIPALTPTHFNQEENGEEEVEQAPYAPVTAPTLVRSTTLRTIIKPDSEVYHSNSGIQVTFNTESKHQVGHEFQEHYEESALQPIITEVHSPSVENTPNVGPFLTQNHHPIANINGNDRARAFDIPYNNNNGQNTAGSLSQSLPNSQNYHRFTTGPNTNLNSQQFLRPTPDQGLLLSYTQNQANRLNQAQTFENRFKNMASSNVQNGPQNHRYHHDAHVLNLGPPPNTPSIKFRTQPTNHQPKPIPIPLHHDDKTLQQSQSSTSHQLQNKNHHQHYTNFNQFRLKQQQQVIPSHQNAQFQQSILQPIRILNQNLAEPPIRNFPSPDHQQNSKVLFQQKQTSAHLGQSTANTITNRPLFTGNTQEFNRLVSGAELVESLPKFEQHITETVPLSEINKPFSPFRTGVRIDSTPHILSQQTQSSSFIPEQHPPQPQKQQQKHIHEELLQPTFEHTKHPIIQQKPIYLQEPTNINSLSPQVIFPVNHHTKNNRLQDQKKFNSLSSQVNHPAPVFYEKVIPGKGVSNLATDVFGDLGQPTQINGRNRVSQQHTDGHTISFNGVQSTERNFVTSNYVSSPTHKVTISPVSTITTTTTVKPAPKKVTADLPDEVPDDLRQQLLSSGILDNADISVLDYDKVGDIPIESLPPEHLANFYGAGGAAQISSSNRVLNIVKPNGDSVVGLKYSTDDDKNDENKSKTLPKKHNIDLKVVRFDSSNQKSVTDKYIKPDSTVLSSVDINQDYNRYLPLKVNGDQFPIPEVESLRNKKISSVVVLAPVDARNENNDEDIIEDGRYERDVIDSKEVKFLGGDFLKNLLRKPTKENFKRWLDKEAKTNVEMQSVVLLVVRNETNGQEIYMYDIGTKVVSRLKGELSESFVNVAESNAQEKDINDESDVTLVDTGIFANMPAMNSDKEKITIIEAHAAYQNEPIFRRDSSKATIKTNSDLTRKISITSGYSVIR